MSKRDRTEQNRLAASPAGQSSGTGGGGNAARDKSPVPTAEAPTPSGLDQDKGSEVAPAPRGGAASGLQPGGTKPTNAPLAGEGQIGTGGGSSGPTDDARKSKDGREPG
jgi:hypothetical protein